MRWQQNNNAISFKVNYSRFSLRSPVSRNQYSVLLLCPCCHGCRLPCMWPLLSLRWCLLLIMRWQHNNNAISFKVNHILLRPWVSRNQTVIIVALLSLCKYFIVWYWVIFIHWNFYFSSPATREFISLITINILFHFSVLNFGWEKLFLWGKWL